jgi:hypothetical protein
MYIPQGGWCGRQGIWMIHIVEEIKLLLLPGNRLKHTRGNVRYLVTWYIKVFTVGCSSQAWYTYDYKIGINKYPGNAGEIRVMHRQGAYTVEVCDLSQTWYTYDYKIGINKYPGKSGN